MEWPRPNSIACLTATESVLPNLQFAHHDMKDRVLLFFCPDVGFQLAELCVHLNYKQKWPLTGS